MINMKKLTDEELSMLLYGMEELDSSLRKESEFTEMFDEHVHSLRMELYHEYESRSLDYTMFES